MTRYLRIACAVAFILLLSALVALWIRSIYCKDLVYGVSRNHRLFQVFSEAGGIGVALTAPNEINYDEPFWRVVSTPSGSYASDGILGFRYIDDSPAVAVVAPYWFLTLLALTCGALFAFKRPRRLSLRSVLLVGTLMAVALVLGVYFL